MKKEIFRVLQELLFGIKIIFIFIIGMCLIAIALFSIFGFLNYIVS